MGFDREKLRETAHTPEGEEPPKGILEEGSLWIMIAAPSVWAAHFLLAYWLAAIWCARIVGREGEIMAVRIGVGVLTIAALALVAWLARLAVRKYEGKLLIDDDLDEDSEPERTRFMGHATLLLCALSAIAIIFDALPAVVFDTCR